MKKFYLKLLLPAIALLCSTVASAHDFEVDGIFYNITDESAKTVEVTFKGSASGSYDDEYSGEVVIPETVEYHGYTYTVTAIGEMAFYACDYLTNVKLPNTIFSIGHSAFRYTSLADIVIPASVESLGSNALSSINGLSKLEIPSNVTKIGSCAVAYVNDLKSLYIGHGVQTVPENAVCYSTSWHSGSNVLNTVYLGSNITDIQAYAFLYNAGITKLYCMAPTPPSVVDYGSYYMYSNSDVVLHVPYGTRDVYHIAEFWDNFPSIVELDYFVVDGISYRVTSEVAATCEVTFDGTTYDEFTQEYVGDIVVPSSITWGGKKYTVTSVGDNAFNGCTSLASVTLPETVTSIGEYAFYNCENLTKVVLPSSLESIGGYAFSGATRNIKDLYVFASQPASLLVSSFYTSLYSGAILHVPCNSAALYKSADYWKNFTNVDELGYFEANGLYYSISSAANSTCEVVKSVVEYCGDVEIPASVVYNGTTYTVTGIGEEAFSGSTSVTSVTIPENVAYIASKAFAGCSGLSSITLPSKLVSLSSSVFYGCTSLETVTTLAPEAPAINELSFAGLSSATSLIYPVGSDYSKWIPYFNMSKEVESQVSMVKYPFYVSETDGLPSNSMVDDNAVWESPLYKFDTEQSGIRITVFESNKSVVYNGYPTVSFAELEFYDESGYKMEYLISDVTTNSLATNAGSLSGLNDGDYSTYYYSTQSAGYGTVPYDYVYVDVKFQFAVSAFKVKWVVRVSNLSSQVLPTSVGFSNTGETCSLASASNSGECGDDASWNLYNGTLIISGNGAVSSTSWSSFSSSIKNIVVEEGITILPAYIFNNYVNLQCASLPSTLTTIGNEAFKGCSSLASVITAATVAPSLGSDVFSGISENAILTIPADSDYSSWEQYFSAFKGNNGEAITALKVLLANAQVLYDNSVEGDNVGEYVKGSKAALQAVIDEVAAKVSDDMLNTDVELLTAQINSAIETFGLRINVNYSNNIKFENVTAHAGEQATILVNMNNVDEIAGFQFDVILPHGVTFAVDDEGYELIDLLTERTTRKKHTLESTLQADGSIRVVCYSLNKAVFSGNEGAVLSMIVNVAEDMADGDYVIDVKDIVMSDSEGKVQHDVPWSASCITVESHISGDVNSDSRINVSDIAGLVCIILGYDTEGFNVKAADVNGDTRINVSDIAALVNIILNSSSSAAAPKKAAAQTRSAAQSSLTIEPFSIGAGEEKEIEVLMENPDTDICQIEFELTLPTGIEIVYDEENECDMIDFGSRTNYKKHSVASNKISENTTKIMCTSQTNALFKNYSGDVLVITVRATDAFTAASAEFSLSNIVLALPDGITSLTPANYAGTISNTTGIEEIMSEQGTAKIYDLQGRKIDVITEKGIYIVNGKKVVIK